MAAAAATGRLILVVGPSGAGKDTLLRGARKALTPLHRFAFPRREVTRQPGAAEDCIAVSRTQFEARREAGAYCLWWRAHAHCYGVRREVEDLLAEGWGVTLNVSRTVVEEARQRFRAAAVVQVHAPPEILRQRLAARRREDAEAIERRLARPAPPLITGPRTSEIVNDGPPEEGIDTFVRLLKRLHPAQA